MTTAHKTWTRALLDNDEEAGRDLIRSSFFSDRLGMLAQALREPTTPSWAFEHMTQAGYFGKTAFRLWVYELAIEFDGIDWARAKAVRSVLVGQQCAQEEITAGWDQLLGDYYRRQNSHIQSRVVRAMVDLLETHPQLVAGLPKQTLLKPGLPATLFELSLLPSKSDWVSQTGIEIERLCAAGAQNLMMQHENGAEKFESWLTEGTGRTEAFEALQQHDAQLEADYQQWRQTWLPDWTWKGSPLEQWHGEAVDWMWDPSTPAPVWVDPNSTAQDARTCVRLPAYALKRNLERIGAATAGYMSKTPVQLGAGVFEIYPDARPAYVEAMRPDTQFGYTMGRCPLDPLVLGIYHHHKTAHAVAQTEDGAQHLQYLVERDERMNFVLASLVPRTAVEMILAQPKWASWQDRQGRSLLELSMDLAINPKWPNKSMLLKLARQYPTILTHPREGGGTTLDVLPIDEAIRSQIKRTLLRNVVAPTRKARPSGPKM